MEYFQKEILNRLQLKHNFLNGITSLRITHLFKSVKILESNDDLNSRKLTEISLDGIVGDHIEDDSTIICDIEYSEKWIKGLIYFNTPYDQTHSHNVVLDLSLKVCLDQPMADFK